MIPTMTHTKATPPTATVGQFRPANLPRTAIGTFVMEDGYFILPLANKRMQKTPKLSKIPKVSKQYIKSCTLIISKSPQI